MMRPRSQNPVQRFCESSLLFFFQSSSLILKIANCQTNTPCGMNFDLLQVFFRNPDALTQVIFISCKPPVDPVELVINYIKTVETTGITRTR